MSKPGGRPVIAASLERSGSHHPNPTSNAGFLGVSLTLTLTLVLTLHEVGGGFSCPTALKQEMSLKPGSTIPERKVYKRPKLRKGHHIGTTGYETGPWIKIWLIFWERPTHFSYSVPIIALSVGLTHLKNSSTTRTQIITKHHKNMSQATATQTTKISTPNQRSKHYR